MKRLIIMTIIFSLMSCSFNAPKKYNELKFSKNISWPYYKITSFRSNNGINFFLVENHELPIIKLNIYVKGGEYAVPRGKEGLGFILAQMLRIGGTKKYPGEKLDVFLEDRAVEYNIDIDLLNGDIYIDLLKKDFDSVIPVIIENLTNPIFTQETLNLAKLRLLTIIARRNDRQEEVGIREFKRIIYGKNSLLGRIPTKKSVENITLEDVRHYYQKLFVGSNLLVGVVGDFDKDKLKLKLDNLFQRFKKGNEIKFDFPKVNSPIKKRYILDKPGSDQAFIILGHLGDYRLNPDFAPLQVMNMVLSGGFSGRLFENIRTKMGLAYSVYGHFGGERYYPGLFFVALKTKNSSVTKAIDAVLGELEKIKCYGAKEKEVEEAKEQFLNSLVFRYDSPTKVIERRLYYEIRDMDPDSFKKLIDDIKGVTVTDVNRVAKKYLHPEDVDILVVGDKKEIGEDLKKIGQFVDWELEQ